MIRNWKSGLYDGIFGEKRLDNRVQKVLDIISQSGSAIVNIAAPNHADKIATYRAFMNERVETEKIHSASFRRCAENIEGEHVLGIHDTTEFNYTSIRNKLCDKDPHIGPTTRKDVPGFFCHPMLVCDPTGKDIFGLGSVSLYNRSWDGKDKYERKYKSLPIEEKESYRWIESAKNTRALIPDEITLTIIAD